MSNSLISSISEEIKSVRSLRLYLREKALLLPENELKEIIASSTDSIFDHLFMIARTLDSAVPDGPYFREDLLIQLGKPTTKRPAVFSEITSFYIRQLLSFDEKNLRNHEKTIIDFEKYLRSWQADLEIFTSRISGGKQ